MTTSDSVRPLTAAEHVTETFRILRRYEHGNMVDSVEAERAILARLDEARAGSLDAAIAAVEALPGGGGLVSRALVLAALREAKP